MRSNQYKLGLFATTILSLGLVAPAVAQEEEIVVTARRVEERLQDVPISITVFNQKQLNNRNIVNAADLAAYTPSLSVQTHNSSDASTFSIRGFVQELKTSATVGTYFADVVSPRAGGQISTGGDGAGPGMLYDLENVQVLKGPQGTLFGRNTTGGAVILLPTKPKGEFGGYIEGGYGNYNMKRLQGVLNVPLGSKARLRVGFDRMTRDGDLTNIGLGPSKLNNVNYINGRASLVVDITPDIENYTVATLTNSDHFGTAPKLIGINPSPVTGYGAALPASVQPSLVAELARLKAAKDFYTVDQDSPNPRNFLQQWWLINSTTWNATDLLTVKNIASYSVVIQDFVQDIWGTDLSGATDPGTTFNGATSHYNYVIEDLLPGQNTNNQYNITEELRFIGRSANNKLTWQAGLYYEQSTPRENVGSFVINKSFCTSPSSANPVCNGGTGFGNASIVSSSFTNIRFRDMAAYGQLTYALWDNLKLDAGFRFTHDESNGWTRPVASALFVGGTSANFCSVATGTFPNCAFHDRKTSDAPTWLLGLDYNVTPDFLTYIKYARGYRQGAVDPVQFTTSGRFYGPEIVDVYEVGTKNEFHGKVPGTLNLAAYYASFAQQQLTVTGFQTVAPFQSTSMLLNAGQSHMWGIELESSLRPFEGFRLDAAADYLYTKLDSASVPSSFAGFGVLVPNTRVNGRLPYSPMYKASVTGTYTFPLPETVGQVDFSATYTYTSSYEATLPPSFDDQGRQIGSPFHKQDAQNLVNLSLNWSNIFGSPVDASFFVTNLLDDTYYLWNTGTFYLPQGASGAGVDAAQVGEPRFFGGRLKLRFGADAH